MSGYLQARAVYVIGAGDEWHRGVAVALAQAGANVAIGGMVSELADEARLHSIANEIWSLGRRAVVAGWQEGKSIPPDSLKSVQTELGDTPLIVRCEPAIET